MKTVLLLGSNSDVGQACAATFAKNGADIILASRTAADFQSRLAADIAIRYDVKTETVSFDALAYDSHQSFYDDLPTKPDVVISVFGILGDQDLATKDFAEAQKIIDTNFTGQVSILNIVANDMEAKGAGTIICVSSVAGERGRKSNYFYGAAKAALTAFLSGLRARLAMSNVQAITVIPGFINTKMIQGLETPKLLTATSQQVANGIWKAYRKKKNTVYVLPIWRWIMLIIKSIPEFIFKKMNL